MPVLGVWGAFLFGFDKISSITFTVVVQETALPAITTNRA